MNRAKTITLTVLLFLFAAIIPCSACWYEYDDDWYDYWGDYWVDNWYDYVDDFNSVNPVELPEVVITPNHDDTDNDWWRRDYDDDSWNDNSDNDNLEDFDCVESQNNTNENSNQYTYESYKEMILKWASSFNDKIKTIIDKLSKEGKIKMMKTQNGEVVKNPRYDPKDGVIILPMTKDYNVESFNHEIIHYIQDNIKILNYNTSSSNNEYQTYVLNFVLNSANGDFATQPQMISPDMWSDFVNDNKGHYGKDNSGVFWYDNTFISHLENLNHDYLVHSFADYYRAINGPKGYYEHIDPNYSWNWAVLLERLGFKKK